MSENLDVQICVFETCPVEKTSDVQMLSENQKFFLNFRCPFPML